VTRRQSCGQYTDHDNQGTRRLPKIGRLRSRLKWTKALYFKGSTGASQHIAKFIDIQASASAISIA